MGELFDVLMKHQVITLTEGKYTKIILMHGNMYGRCHMKKTEHKAMFPLGCNSIKGSQGLYIHKVRK